MKKRKPENIAQEDWDAVDSPPLSDSLLSAMKPVGERHPEIPPRVRGPQKAPRKVPVALRLDPSIVNAFSCHWAGLAITSQRNSPRLVERAQTVMDYASDN